MATIGAVGIMEMVAAAGTVASAGVAAYSSIQQGQATANADKQKATAETLKETQNQINMRQNLLKALASQNAGTLGAVATGAATGFGANVTRQLNQGTNDLMVSKANASSQVSLLDNAASDATAAGAEGAATDAFGGLSKGASQVASILQQQANK